MNNDIFKYIKKNNKILLNKFFYSKGNVNFYYEVIEINDIFIRFQPYYINTKNIFYNISHRDYIEIFYEKIKKKYYIFDEKKIISYIRKKKLNKLFDE